MSPSWRKRSGAQHTSDTDRPEAATPRGDRRMSEILWSRLPLIPRRPVGATSRMPRMRRPIPLIADVLALPLCQRLCASWRASFLAALDKNHLTLFRARREKIRGNGRFLPWKFRFYPPLPQNPLFSWIHGLRLMSSRRSRGLAVEIAETDDCRAKGQQGLGSNCIGIIAAAAQPPNFPLWPH